MLFEACEKSVLLACLWGDCVTDILQTVRWGMQVGKMERVSLKKIVGIYQLKGKHISQVWEVKKESCFSALISCNVKNHCTTDLWKAQVFNKRTYIKCILKNSVSSLVYFYFDFWVFLPHSVTISAGSWVDGLQELLRVPWHLFRWVGGSSWLHNTTLHQELWVPETPWLMSCTLCPGWSLSGKDSFVSSDLASSCSTVWLCRNTTGNCCLGVILQTCECCRVMAAMPQD